MTCITGTPRPRVTKLHQRLHPDDRERLVQAYDDVVAGRRSDLAVEFRQRTAQGGFPWVRSLGRIVVRTAPASMGIAGRTTR